MNSPKFRSIWLRVKLKDLSDEEIRNYNRNSFNSTLVEGREMIKNSGMFLVPGWDFEKIYLSEQIMRHKDPNFVKQFNDCGFGVSIDLKAFSLWSRAPNVQKPLILQGG